MEFYQLILKELYVHVAYVILAQIEGSVSCFMFVLDLYEINQ
jgi:hypothetical protein